MDLWTSPPLELLLEVFRRLDITDVVRCAGTCKLWRRAIISHATSSLRPRPDRFFPDLLLGFFFDKKLNGKAGVSLHRTTGPAFQNPASVGLALYYEPLSSRDGLLLLNGSSEVDGAGGHLCLYNTMTGDHTFIPAAAFKPDAYVLVTGYDLSPSDDLGARILAVQVVHAEDYSTVTFRHQQFFSPISAWGPVKRTPEFMKNLSAGVLPGSEVVCGGAVHWLGVWTLNRFNWFGSDLTVDEIQAYTLAVDVRTGRTWATKLPDECRHAYSTCSLVLATSGDGRLSAVMDGRCHGDHGSCILVWVLVSEEHWSLEWTVPVPAFSMRTELWMNNIVFCPRSGCVMVEVEGGDLLIEVDKGSSRRIQHLTPSVYSGHGYSRCGNRYPYEMDWSTYLSRMKSF